MSIRFARFSRLLLALAVLASASGCSNSGNATQASGASGGDRAFVQPEVAKIERAPDAAAIDPAPIIEAYNTRNFGSPGWRSVSLELITEGELTRSFTVVNLWRSVGDETRTLFLLQEPEGLSGTNYLLTEGKGDAESLDMRVHLFLPSGQRQVLEIAPNEFNEGLLGSDFTYTDLRMRMPLHGYNYRVIGQTVLRNEPAWVLEAEPESEAIRRAVSWSLARFYLAKNFQFLLGADYFNNPEDANDPARPSKQMRVESFEQESGIWTATRMVMVSSDNRYSVLGLKNAHFQSPGVGSELFLPHRLPELADKIQEGWSPEAIQTARR
jgi:hypothetical protein